MCGVIFSSIRSQNRIAVGNLLWDRWLAGWLVQVAWKDFGVNFWPVIFSSHFSRWPFTLSSLKFFHEGTIMDGRAGWRGNEPLALTDESSHIVV